MMLFFWGAGAVYKAKSLKLQHLLQWILQNPTTSLSDRQPHRVFRSHPRLCLAAKASFTVAYSDRPCSPALPVPAPARV